MFLLDKLNLKHKLTAIYDAPSGAPFTDVIEPTSGKRVCMFAYFNAWNKGKTLRLTPNNYGCGGCGHWWFSKETRTLEEYVEFLANEEGLKASKDAMKDWFISSKPYRPIFESIFIGPYREKPEISKYAKTITFWANADQLSILSTAANYFSTAGQLPVIAPFGSGCMQILSLFKNLETPQAIIGSLDLAMRQYLPPQIFAFTITIPMFELFKTIDKNSFLNKPFLNSLIRARGGTL